MTLRPELVQRLEEALRKAVDVTTELRDNTVLAREQVLALRSLRKDVYTLLTLLKEVVNDAMPDVRKHLDEAVSLELEKLAQANKEAIARQNQLMNARFDQLMAIIESPGPSGKTLGETLERHAQFKFLLGDPITSAAEPVRKGEILDVNGKDYEMGADVSKIGTLLFLSTKDGKLYPAPTLED